MASRSTEMRVDNSLVPDLATNVLYHGHNLDILRRYLPEAAIDLVELDPPFEFFRDYSVVEVSLTR